MRSTRALAAIVAVLALAAPAAAQTSSGRLARADAAGALGWFNARKVVPDANSYDNDWYNRSLYGGGSAGWYWTDNWKTELEAGATTEADLRATQLDTVNGRLTTFYSTYQFSTRRIAVGQHYQFFRNAWVHPFVGGGLDLAWETIDRYDEQYSSAGPSRIEHPERSEFHARPFATLGLKAYMTQRGFFRTDLKFVAASHGLEEVTLRLGLGIDF
jgi:outer membrane protein W